MPAAHRCGGLDVTVTMGSFGLQNCGLVTAVQVLETLRSGSLGHLWMFRFVSRTFWCFVLVLLNGKTLG